MSRTLVVVKKGDRVWDSIKDTERQALFRVCEYMKESKDDPDIYRVGRNIWLKLIFGREMEHAIESFKAEGFEVSVKPVEGQTNV